MSTEPLERAFATTRRVLVNIGPDDYDTPTVCRSWQVRDIVNHVVTGSHWFAATMNAGEGPLIADQTFTHGDVVAAYDDGIEASLAAFGAPGALEKAITLPFGELTGAVLMGLAATDQLTHGWDLARATGQPTDLDPELADALLEGAKARMQGRPRGPDGTAPFGPEVLVDDDAPAADRLAAFLGRTP
jgi:uncharacterized protein (TIGR03086 family)